MLTWQQRVRIAQDMSKGLLFLHQHFVIHRDFKAANVLLTEVGGHMQCHLSDAAAPSTESEQGLKASRALPLHFLCTDFLLWSCVLYLCHLMSGSVRLHN